MKPNQHSKQGGQKPFFATLDEAKQNCKSYYEANGQLRDCTCGTCPNHPQQQESWQDDFDREFGNYDNSMFNVWKIGSAETSEKTFNQLKAFIKDLLDKKAREIEARGYRKNKPGWEKISTEVKFYGMGYNDGLDDALKILKGEE